MRYLGIDYGLKKIGLAIGDDESKIASPIDIIENKNCLEVIKKIVQDEFIDIIVIGIPERTGEYHSEDQENITKDFIENLKILNIPIKTVGEQYTSVESQKLQSEGSEVGEDALAAMLILQEYLNNLA